MAKIARAVIYMWDSNDDYYNLGEELERVVSNHTDMFIQTVGYDEKKFEWDDNLIINYDCRNEDIAKFYRELPKEN